MSDELTRSDEFRTVLIAIIGLSVLLIGKLITEDEFIACLKENLCGEPSGAVKQSQEQER